MAVSPLQDIMNHYLWNFSAYLPALATILLNAARSMYLYLRSKYRPLYLKCDRLDLLISLLCGVSLVMGLAFQGVLTDSNASDVYHQSSYLQAAYLASLALFVTQIVFRIKTPFARPRVEPTDEVPALQIAPQKQSQPQTPLEQPAVSQEDSAPKDGE